MKPSVVLILSVLISGAMIFIASSWTAQTPPSTSTAPAASADEVAGLSRSISEVRAQQAALKQSLDDLRAELAIKPQAEARVPLGEIDAAVQRALAGKSAAPAPSVAQAAEKAPSKKKFDRQAALSSLTEPGATSDQTQALWKQIAEAGEMDAMVALFEQRAKEDARNSMAQVELGRAYLQKLFTVGGGPEAGVWGMKADKAFDAALVIDDHNWEARFQKAVSLSFWPPMLGKQGEAIKNFEVLLEQQAGQAPKSSFAQTYLFLGNMYTQTGDKAKALATWQQGLSLFPGNSQLENQIANAQGH